MKIEIIERVGRIVAAVAGGILLTLAVVIPTWWGILGIVPLAIALTGW